MNFSNKIFNRRPPRSLFNELNNFCNAGNYYYKFPPADLSFDKTRFALLVGCKERYAAWARARENAPTKRTGNDINVKLTTVNFCAFYIFRYVTGAVIQSQML